MINREAVSAGDWMLTDQEGQTHLIDGPVRMAANTRMLLAATLAGAGIAYGPTFVFGERIAARELIALLPDHRTSELAIHALYPSARNISLKARRFIDHLIASFGADPPWDRAPATPDGTEITRSGRHDRPRHRQEHVPPRRVDKSGTIALRIKVSRSQLVRRLVNPPPCLVGLKAGSGSHHIARQIQLLNHDVLLIPAQYVMPGGPCPR